MGTSSMFLIAALVCWICDSALSHGHMLSWSLIVDLMLVCSWLVMLPLFAAKRRFVLWTLTVFSLISLPWIFLLSRLLNEPAIFQMGRVIAPVVLIFLWMIYFVCRKLYRQKWRAAAVICILMALLECSLDIMIAHLLSEPWAFKAGLLMPGVYPGIGSCIFLILTAGLCFMADRFIRTA